MLRISLFRVAFATMLLPFVASCRGTTVWRANHEQESPFNSYSSLEVSAVVSPVLFFSVQKP